MRPSWSVLGKSGSPEEAQNRHFCTLCYYIVDFRAIPACPVQARRPAPWPSTRRALPPSSLPSSPSLPKRAQVAQSGVTRAGPGCPEWCHESGPGQERWCHGSGPGQERWCHGSEPRLPRVVSEERAQVAQSGVGRAGLVKNVGVGRAGLVKNVGVTERTRLSSMAESWCHGAGCPRLSFLLARAKSQKINSGLREAARKSRKWAPGRVRDTLLDQLLSN